MSVRCIPPYQITPKIAKDLLRIDVLKERIVQEPLSPEHLAFFQETNRLYSTYYSTLIEGNQLEPEQISAVLNNEMHFNGCEKDEYEVKGYYKALLQIGDWIKNQEPITEKKIQILHALVMQEGQSVLSSSSYRKGQNLVFNGRTKSIAYVPPDAKEVPFLIKNLMAWMNGVNEIPSPIVAGIAHYQLISIHPFYSGNGRTARLLTTYILRQRGYNPDGILALEEYYASNLTAYFEAISMSPLHNYFLGRSQADITPWVQYFVEGLVISLEKGAKKIEEIKRDGLPLNASGVKKLDAKQLKALAFFREFTTIQAHQIP